MYKVGYLDLRKPEIVLELGAYLHKFLEDTEDYNSISRQEDDWIIVPINYEEAYNGKKNAIVWAFAYVPDIAETEALIFRHDFIAGTHDQVYVRGVTMVALLLWAVYDDYKLRIN